MRSNAFPAGASAPGTCRIRRRLASVLTSERAIY
jgi:hypothetical protein